MNRILSLAIVLSVVLSAAGGTMPRLVTRDEAVAATDSLIAVLDHELTIRDRYEEMKRVRIANLTTRLSTATDATAKMDALSALFDEYCDYNLDTALIYSRMSLSLAMRYGDLPRQVSARLNCSEALKSLGDCHRALEELDSVPRGQLDDEQLRYYYNRYVSVYLSLFEQYAPGGDAEHYRRRVIEYRDSVMSLHEPGQWQYELNRAENLKAGGNPAEALEIYTAFVCDSKEEFVDEAVLSYLLGDTYERNGEPALAKYYFLKSAILDMRSCTKKYMSLQELAYILNEEGDTEHAYRYINTSLRDITASGARSRLSQVADFMPVINDTYSELLQREARSRRWQYILLGGIVAVLMALLVVLRRTNRRGERQREVLADSNRQLREASERFEALNDRLRDLNGRLEESNRIKEAYIGDLFNLCSEYMESMSKYRRSLRRMLKVGHTDEMAAALARPAGVESMKDFLHKFDAIFLDIFPDFIERFNGLLEPEARIVPAKGDLLTPELRIYALVRLGINDSTRIAAFLNYSPQTVYNYRQRVRDRAVVPKKEFVDHVMRL